MTTLLVIDIGNTNVSLGIFDYAQEGGDTAASGQLAQHWRLATHHEQTSDEVALLVRGLFDHASRAIDEVTDVIISSVVPPLLPIFERVCVKLFDRPPSSSDPACARACPSATRIPARWAPTGSSTRWPPSRSWAVP